MAKDNQIPGTNPPAKKTSAKAAKKVVVKKSATAQAPAKTPVAAKPSKEQLLKEISVRAYEIYCGRGAQHGSHNSDWLRAEAEIRAKYRM
ncbi:MAG: DUF2934 domain-containing protein [Acidobacteriota bacterium]|nr:DUF2934 domain-containing protein [Acidobacteriota bacterium]